MILILLSAGILVAGYALMAVGLRDAPEAYEDETGFHLVWRNNAPETADVVCIWAARSDVSAFEDFVEIRNVA